MNYLLASLMIFSLSISLQAADAPRALILYTEPPNSWVTALEITTLTPGSIVFSIANLPDGKRQEIPRTGIIAVLNYPPEPPARVTEEEAAAALKKIGTNAQKYPQFRTKFSAASVRWNKALVFAKTATKPITAQSSPPRREVGLEIDGVRYLNVMLMASTGSEVTISHSDGVATIQAKQLTPSHITVLNTTNTAIQIDPAKIVQQPPANTPSVVASIPAPSLSVRMALENTPALVRLKEAASTAQAAVQKISAQASTLRARMEATAVHLRSEADYYNMERQSVKLSDEERVARTRFDQAHAKVQDFKVEAYRAAAVLPPTSSDWDNVVKQWTAEVIEQTAVADAARKAVDFNNPNSTTLSKNSDSEKIMLEAGKQALANAKRKAEQSKTVEQVEMQRVAKIDRDKARDELRAKQLQQFESLVVNTDRFVIPLLRGNLAGPSYQETIAFIAARLPPKSSMGFGERAMTMIVRMPYNETIFSFDPKDLNAEVRYNAEGVTLMGRNRQNLIKVYKPSIKGTADEPQMELASEFYVHVGDAIDAEKMATALSHLIRLFGGGKEAF